MGTGGRQAWFLMIVRDGHIKYANAMDGCFRSSKPHHLCVPYPFESPEAAKNCYDQWAKGNPVLAREWIPRVEEVEL